VYTIEFIKKLAMAIEVDWQVVLAGVSIETRPGGGAFRVSLTRPVNWRIA